MFRPALCGLFFVSIMLLTKLLPNGQATCPVCNKTRHVHVYGGNLVLAAGERYLDMGCLTCHTVFRMYPSAPGGAGNNFEVKKKPTEIIQQGAI